MGYCSLSRCVYCASWYCNDDKKTIYCAAPASTLALLPPLKNGKEPPSQPSHKHNYTPDLTNIILINFGHLWNRGWGLWSRWGCAVKSRSWTRALVSLWVTCFLYGLKWKMYSFRCKDNLLLRVPSLYHCSVWTFSSLHVIIKNLINFYTWFLQLVTVCQPVLVDCCSLWSTCFKYSWAIRVCQKEVQKCFTLFSYFERRAFFLCI